MLSTTRTNNITYSFFESKVIFDSYFLDIGITIFAYICRLNLNGSRALCESTSAQSQVPEDREYYNDMPDKSPPDNVHGYRHPPPPPLGSLAPISS